MAGLPNARKSIIVQTLAGGEEFMRGTISAGAGAAMLLASPGFPAAAQPAAQPARWHVDGATNRCVLSRRLQGTPSPATFVLRTIPGSGRYELILAGRELPAEARRERRDSRVMLAPAGISYEGPSRSVELPGELERGVAFGPFPAALTEQIAATSTLRLADGTGAELGSWAIPSAARAIEALAYCEAEKRIEWGADPASVEPGSTAARPVGQPSAWVMPRDLGLAQATASAVFTAVYRLMIGPDGQPTSCTQLEVVTNIAQPGDVCRTLIRRARYEPARSAAGAAVASAAIHYVSLRQDIDFRTTGG